MLIHFAILRAVPLVAALGLGARPEPGPAWILCSPGSVQQQGKPAKPSRHAIAEALDAAQPGTTVLVEPGDYPPLRIGFNNKAADNSRTSGGMPGAPIVVLARAGAVIHGGTGDAITISQDVPNAYITFQGLEIRPGARSGVLFSKSASEHRGYRFEDCDVIGDYDHASASGGTSKWGVWGNNMAEFAFIGVRRPARVENIRNEHGFYIQNPSGPILIENVQARALGRTFVQLTARHMDGAGGSGDVTVRRCVVEDVGLSAWDGYKGGSAFTVGGGLSGRLLFEGNSYRAGFDPSLVGLTNNGRPYGTSAFVAWQESRADRNGILILRDNEFVLAPGCGDRPVVSIGGCAEVELAGKNRFVSGGTEPALALDPVGDDQQPTSSPNGSVHIAGDTVLEGALTVGAETKELSELAR